MPNVNFTPLTPSQKTQAAIKARREAAPVSEQPRDVCPTPDAASAEADACAPLAEALAESQASPLASAQASPLAVSLAASQAASQAALRVRKPTLTVISGGGGGAGTPDRDRPAQGPLGDYGEDPFLSTLGRRTFVFLLGAWAAWAVVATAALVFAFWAGGG